MKICLFACATGCLVIAGCVSGPDIESLSRVPRGEELQTSVPVEIALASRLADHFEWIKRLQVAAPDQKLVGISDQQAARIPVPLKPEITAGNQYVLAVDHQKAVAWLHKFGPGGSDNRAYGPWSVQQPDVAHLLHSLSTPPSGENANRVPESS